MVQGALDADHAMGHRTVHLRPVRKPRTVAALLAVASDRRDDLVDRAPRARVLLWTLFAAGWATVLVVTFLINHFDLFGLRQVWLPLIGHPYTRGRLPDAAALPVVRHPLYLGFLFAFWMTPTMTLAHLVFAIATTVYIVLAIQFEERDLIAEHGPSYTGYRRRRADAAALARRVRRDMRRTRAITCNDVASSTYGEPL